MMTYLRPALALTLLFTILTGIAYPLAITGLAQALMPRAANGSLIIRGNQVVGSALIGETFASGKYFHGRPSAAGANGYDAAASSGSNLGPSSKTLLGLIQERVVAEGGGPAPADLVTASASGLDPDISPAAAAWQIGRVAKARNLSEDEVRNLVGQHTQGYELGVLGQPRVNVLELNLALDGLRP